MNFLLPIIMMQEAKCSCGKSLKPGDRAYLKAAVVGYAFSSGQELFCDDCLPKEANTPSPWR